MYLATYLQIFGVFLVVQVGKAVHNVMEDAVRRRGDKTFISFHTTALPYT